MKEFIDEYGTRLYGGLTTLFGSVGGLVTTGAFNELLTKPAIGWLGIVCTVSTAVLGAMTMSRGFTNDGKIKIAQAMQSAINATPAERGYARVPFMAVLASIALVALALSGCASSGVQVDSKVSKAATETAKVVGRIALRREISESPRFAEKARNIRKVIDAIGPIEEFTTVSLLREAVDRQVDKLGLTGLDRQDADDLLDLWQDLLDEEIEGDRLDSDARVKVDELLQYVLAFLPPPA